MDDLYRDETKWDLLQVRISPDQKQDIKKWCLEHGLTLSVYLRMVIAKTLNDDKTMKDSRQIEPVINAVQEVYDVLPMILRQRNFQHRY